MTDIEPPDSTTFWSTHLTTVLLVVALLATATVGVASAQVPVTDGTVFEASDDGPTVEITQNLTLDSPVTYSDNRTVDLAPNATFVSDGATDVTIDSIDGAWTNLTTHDVAAGLEVDPHDKQAVAVAGEDVSTVAFRDVDRGAGVADLVYDADAVTEVTVGGLPENSTVYAVDLDAAERVAVGTTGIDGDATLDLDAGSDCRIDVREATSATIDNESASPHDGTAGTAPTLGVNVVSEDFPQDELTANFTLGGEVVGNDTLTGNGTASVNVANLDRGENYEWNVTVTDEYDFETESEGFSFSVPAPSSGGGSARSIDGTTESVRIAGDQLSATVDTTQRNGVSTSSLEVAANAGSTLTFDFESEASSDRATVDRIETTADDDIDGGLEISQADRIEDIEDDVPSLESGTDIDTTGYFSIEHDMGGELDETTLAVGVPSDRLAHHDGDANDVTVYHYVDDEWTALETTLVDETGARYRYEATTDSFSAFAVGVESPASDQGDTDTADGSDGTDIDGGGDETDADDGSSGPDDDSTGATDADGGGPDADEGGAGDIDMDDGDDANATLGVGVVALFAVILLIVVGRWRWHTRESDGSDRH